MKPKLCSYCPILRHCAPPPRQYVFMCWGHKTAPCDTLWTHGLLTLSTSFEPPQQYTLKSTLSQQARRKPLGASCQQMSECGEHLRLSSTLKSTKNTFRAHIKAYISIFSPQSGHIYKKRAHCYCLSSFSSLKYILIGSPCKFKVDKFC